MAKRPTELDALFDLDIRYSLTLHDPSGKRILGHDNSHAVAPPKKGFAGRR